MTAIPLVDGARNSAGYRSAVDGMLSALEDGNTHAELSPEHADPPPGTAPPAGDPVRFDGGVLFIDAARIARIAARDRAAFRDLRERSEKALPRARSLVLDLRDRRRSSPEAGELDAFALDLFLRGFFEQALDGTVALASVRYRMHNGCPPHSGATSGGYASAFATRTPVLLVGQNASPTPPIAILVDEETSAGMDLAAGLQAAGRAVIVQDGPLTREPGIPTYIIELPEGVRVRMRTAELVDPAGRVGFEPTVVATRSEGRDAAMASAIEALRTWSSTPSRHRSPRQAERLLPPDDDPYPKLTFPPREFRLLALFRFWNVIHYFYPYKGLIDRPWDGVLPRYIPLFEANADAADYHRTLRELVAEMQDSHGHIAGLPAEENWYPPFNVRFVEGQTVVDFILKEARGLRLWDSILSVDGQSIEDFRRERSRRISASTPQALESALHYTLFSGKKGDSMRFGVRGLDGRTREVSMSRSVSGSDPRWDQIGAVLANHPLYGVLPSGFGYVDLPKLERSEVDRMFEAIGGASAVIFDMRGYPRGTVWDIAPRLTDRRDVIGARFSRPFREALALGDEEEGFSPRFTFDQPLPPPRGAPYRGRVVVLIDENAISHAEHSCLFLEAATDVTFIGTPTAGANGDVTTLVVPGNLVISFTGHDVRHADGRQLQRVGIQPTVRVAPTIRGLSEGRDEVLEAAVAYLSSKGEQP